MAEEDSLSFMRSSSIAQRLGCLSSAVSEILLAAVKCSFELHTDAAVENAEVRVVFSAELCFSSNV